MEAEILPSQSLGDGIGLPVFVFQKDVFHPGP